MLAVQTITQPYHNMNSFWKNFLSEFKINTITGLVFFIIFLISRTLRLKIFGSAPIIEGEKAGENYIFAFWHDQFFLMPYIYKKCLGKSPISVLTSLSKDGEYISRLLHRFEFNTVRGSSTYKGEAALRLMVKEIERGSNAAVTPDGPKGPRHIVQAGVISLASMTACDIVPVGYKVNRKKILNTWDKFIIPCPFTKGIFTVSSPIHVPRNITDSQKEEIRQNLEKTLLSISEG